MEYLNIQNFVTIAKLPSENLVRNETLKYKYDNTIG